jgi:ubiquinone biosynthesis protein UbiJ
MAATLSSMQRSLDESLVRVGTLIAERDGLAAQLTTAREAIRTQRDEIAALRAQVAALEADRRVGPLAQLPPQVIAADDDCPI